jgi:uncharacterized alpha-E superfamily protein
MLSRTADQLFWMARYTERAENTARMLDVHLRASLLNQPADDQHPWRAVLVISELEPLFNQHYDEPTQDNVLHFMVANQNNFSSIAACLLAARENARAVRGSLTTEIWETVNTTWLELQHKLASGEGLQDAAAFFDWIKMRAHLTRGVTIGTALRDDAVFFTRLGTFLERADNTARLLDVKFYDAATDVMANHSSDFYYWGALLRSVSGFEIYRKVYRDVITPERVAELLILRADMPRSLHSSMREIHSNLAAVRNNRSAETERLAGKLLATLQYSNIDDIMTVGLHSFLDDFLKQTADLGNRISRDFLVPLSI